MVVINDMSKVISKTDIQHVARLAHLNDYSGNFSELGGGEINDTFLLDCDARKVILRVARYEDQKSLMAEAATLALLDLSGVPRLIFFDENQRLRNKLWILESYIKGRHVPRLDASQFRNLGMLLARVHASTLKEERIDVWASFLKRRKQYGDEKALLNHPDKRLRSLIRRARDYVKTFQEEHSSLHCSMIHGDATPTNILIDDDKVSLIDWEFSHFNDPVAEFATIYYDDMDYNDGKWRIHISDTERAELFAGYKAGGGLIDEDRIRLWMNVDKVGAALYLYWRLNLSDRDTTPEQTSLYEREWEQLVKSLENQLT